MNLTSRPTSRLSPIGLVVASVLLGSAGSASASDEAAELRSMLKQIQERLEALEKKDRSASATPAVAPAPAAGRQYIEAGDLPGSFRVPGSDTSIKLYGNVRMDTTYDFKGRIGAVNSYGWANSLFLQPFDNSTAGKRTGQTFATARGSRFGFLSSTPTDEYGPITTKLEGDFDGLNTLGGETQTTVRLREAWGKIGGLLVGQTWSTFVDLRAQPDLIEWNGTGITPTIRQAMARYSLPVGSRGRLDLAVENSIGSTLAKSPVADYDTGFDYVAAYTQDTDWGHFSLRAVTLSYKNDQHNKQGYGIGASTRINLGRQDSIVLQAAGGEGIGRYMYNGLVQGAVNTPDGIRLWRAWGAHAGYTHRWSDSLRSTIAMAETHFERDDLANTTQRANSPAGADFYPNEKLRQFWINTFWNPARNVDLGVDYSYGRRETFNGEKGTASRLGTMLRYNFN